MSKYHFAVNQAPKTDGRFFRITKENFPALRNLAVQDLDMSPGEVREPHLHPNATQMDYCLSGSGQVGIIGPEGKAEVIELTEGDAAYIPQGYVHWIKNNSSETARFILIVSNEMPETIELPQIQC